MHDLKVRVHRELLDRLDLNSLARMNPEQASAQLRRLAGGLLDEQAVPLGARERDQLVDEVMHEVYGLGPIEPLLHDPEVADILVNGPRQVYVERAGRLELTPIVFRDDAHLMQIIDRIVSRMDRRIDESSPMVDARLPDGSRVNAVIPPLAIDGPVLSIRRFGHTPLSMQNLIENGSLTSAMAGLLRAMVRARLNILISGGTGSGKTTLLNCLTAYVPDVERIVTIEDSAELQLQQPHVVRLETRPPNIEGRGEVTQRDLVRNALRMRPDRIIVGEVRGAEALDMLQAMNTGHDGSISTIHANSARDSFARLEVMMQMAGLALGTRAMRQQITQAIDVVVQTARLSDGSRKVVAMSEVMGMEGETIVLQDLFLYERAGVGVEGRISGCHASTGIRPRFADRIKASGHEVEAQALAYLER
ncbi:MAG TPA: CpaF family protein [Candidatus Binatia bacterium]|nr:CpaF family protein [Candidatus Binatia bacterium]